MASISRFKNEERVRVKKGPHAGKTGTVKDLLPDACKVKIGRESQWFTHGDDLEQVKASR